MYKAVSEITPTSAIHECPYNCAECEHCIGITKLGGDIMVDCDLEGNED